MENLVARQIFWFPGKLGSVFSVLLSSLDPQDFLLVVVNVILNTCRPGKREQQKKKINFKRDLYQLYTYGVDLNFLLQVTASDCQNLKANS
jgi:hypothetical protein